MVWKIEKMGLLSGLNWKEPEEKYVIINFSKEKEAYGRIMDCYFN